MTLIAQKHFGQGAGLFEQSSGAVQFGDTLPRFFIPLQIVRKLDKANRTNLGASGVLGNFMTTGTADRKLIDGLNNFLKEKLDPADLDFILSHMDHFTFSIGIGDRRDGAKKRYAVATNWHGETVSGLSLQPDPQVSDSPVYQYKLWFNATTGLFHATDNHVGEANHYGAIRSLVCEIKQE